MPDQQLALTRQRQASQSKADRQTPAQFVQKLYQIVDDESTDHLIKWTETGDSFVVLDHERLGSELLPYWFKHKNWSTFVRQLNMYGFRKQPHLQRGVLKGGADSEYANYEHPYFKRGQPELLSHILRKNQQTDKDGNSVDSLPSTALSPKRNLDINAILEGITAIKQHQANISAELQDLRNQNARLWEQTYESQTKFQKQEDTINRILKFLAGVFGGHHSSQVREEGVNHGEPPRSVMTRKPQRLMIGHILQPPPKVVMTEVDDVDDGPVASIETPPSTVVPSPSVAPRSPILPPSESSQPAPNTESVTLAQLMQQEPEQLKKLLSALSSTSTNNHQLTTYNPLDFTRSLIPPTSPPPIHPELAENSARLENTWTTNGHIARGVDDLQNSLSEFMANIGMDPGSLDATTSSIGPTDELNANPFDFESLLNSFGSDGTSGVHDLTYPPTSYDNMPSPVDTNGTAGSPILSTLPDVGFSRGQKRKSDVADLGGINLGAVDTSILPLSVDDATVPFDSPKTKRRR